MIVSRKELNNFIDLKNITDKKLVEKLNNIGLEVDEVIENAIPKKVVIGYVLECNKHENADKLNVCKVDIGNETLQIVCGAKNVRKDLYVAVAKVGADLGNNFIIKKSNLRGVDSEGMICSSKELGLSNTNNGILELENDFSKNLGKEFGEIYKNTIFDISITPNRGDCVSIYGISRDLASAFTLPLKYESSGDIYQNFEYNISIFKIDEIFNLSYDKRIFLAYKNLLTGDLHEDIANYITEITGVNTTIIKAQKSPFSVSNGKLLADNEELYEIGVKTLKENSIDDDIYFLSHYVHPKNISKKIRDKNKDDYTFYRSFRGSSPYIDDVYVSLDRLGFKYKRIFNDAKKSAKKSIKFKSDDINDLIGFNFKNEDILNILNSLKIDTSLKNDTFLSKIPAHRHDIEEHHDLSEEVLRIYGIDNIPPQKIYLEEIINENDNEYIKYLKSLKEKAASQGYMENINFLFTSKDLLKKMGYKILKENSDIKNPITSDLDTLRTSLIPNLFTNLLFNLSKGIKNIKFFEIGSVYDEKREEKLKLAFISTLHTKNSFKSKGNDLEDFIKEISNIVGHFELENKGDTIDIMHPYKSANILKNDKKIGYISVANPEFLNKEKNDDFFFAEIEISYEDIDKKFSKYSNLMDIYRDFNFVVPKNIAFSELKHSISSLKNSQISDIYAVDDYDMGDKNSITFRITIKQLDNAMDDKEINDICDKVIEKLKKDFDIELRT